MFGGSEFPGGSGLIAGSHGGIGSASPNSRQTSGRHVQ
jgi:hypothetical protein